MIPVIVILWLKDTGSSPEEVKKFIRRGFESIKENFMCIIKTTSKIKYAVFIKKLGLV